MGSESPVPAATALTMERHRRGKILAGTAIKVAILQRCGELFGRSRRRNPAG